MTHLTLLLTSDVSTQFWELHSAVSAWRPLTFPLAIGAEYGIAVVCHSCGSFMCSLSKGSRTRMWHPNNLIEIYLAQVIPAKTTAERAYSLCQ